MDTPVNAPIDEKIRIEISKISQLPFKKKVEYIWDYYKFYIFGFIIVLLVLAGLIYTRVINPAPETVLFVSWNAGIVTNEQIFDLENHLQELLIDKNENKKLMISEMSLENENPTFTMANLQRIMAMVATEDLDVLVLDSEMVLELSKAGLIRPLDAILAEAKTMNPEVYNAINEYTIVSQYENNDREMEERIMGVSIKNSPLLEGLGFIEQDWYVSISSTTRNIEMIAKMLIALFE